MIFDSDARQELLFDDRNFSNSKKYFWALQSLKIFTEYIDGTLRTISPIMYLANNYDDSPNDHEKGRKIIDDIDEFRTRFEGLRDRLERKRQEVQTLRDGVGNPDSNAGTCFLVTDYNCQSFSQLRPSQKVAWQMNKVGIYVCSP